MNWMLVTQ